MKAASRIFARDGFEASRIDEIATEAGYTRGAFYAHFKTKEDLFFALLEEQSSLRLEQIRGLLESCSNEEQRLQTIREYYAGRLVERQWSILILEFKLYALRHPKLRAKLVESHRRIRSRMKLQELECLLPAQFKSAAETHELKRLIFEVLLNGIALEQAYDAENLSQAQASDILRSLFDILVKARKP